MKNLPKVIDGIEFKVNREVKVSSLDVAESFNREHKNVIQAIETLLKASEKSRLIFQPSEYTKRGKTYKAYNMNRDGFSVLVMGFTGKDALEWKFRYIEAFNKMEQFIIAEIERQKNDDTARLECRPMTKALKDTRGEIGKETKPFHYSNEHNMIYRVVLGVTKKKWCEAHDIDKKERFRDYMPAPMIDAIADMQRVNTDLIELGMEYKERKAKLDKLYTKRHLQKCLDEIDNQEA